MNKNRTIGMISRTCTQHIIPKQIIQCSISNSYVAREIMEILNNPWFIGIGGGILSGVIVTAISRFVFSKRDNREYAQKVSTVNKEVIYAIRPGISEGEIPTKEIIKSLIESTSRKYGVESKDVYTPAEIADDLIKEVMDSSFISAKTKNDYCKKLDEIKPISKEKLIPQIEKEMEIRKSVLSAYRDRMIRMMSIMLGVISAIMTLVFSFSEIKNTKLPSNYEVLLPTIIIAFTLVVMTLALYLYRKIIQRDRLKRLLDYENKLKNKVDEAKSNITSSSSRPL
jgi:hypothetical protein